VINKSVDMRHALRTVIELANLDDDSYFGAEVIEALLDRVMDDTLCLTFNKGEVLFQNSFDRKEESQEDV